ncbi:hypothetical protein YYC_05151 [Plasmodium yoelii 17X]|uniref:cDNA EST yk491a11.5 comes from this gene, putative n=2 Tax=Plasmodium yoelii TaxID=5861 RepID=Q7RJ85_PLAYO|nr:cDNA EST yk491a11.5 comes from this gene, putative [Plasmodium yoelii yoelii]ETB56768.1 hypothetical protein YYC_05151 [Plasmodium yoelii 17X]
MQPSQMNEKKISKITLLLLINEIINLNIKLVKDNILDIENVGNGDNNKFYNDKFDNEKFDKKDSNSNSKENCNEIEKDKDCINIMSKRLKNMGKSIGLKMIEHILIYKNNLVDIKDIIKVIGKDMWYIIFNKHIDKLQTYKKNVYIIVDNDITVYLKHTLIDNQTNKKNNFIHFFIIFIIGIIKGVLTRFKINAYITYNLHYPTCKF